MYTWNSVETGNLGSDWESLLQAVCATGQSVFVSLGFLIIKMGMLTLGWIHETDIFVGQKSVNICNFIWFNLIPIS